MKCVGSLDELSCEQGDVGVDPPESCRLGPVATLPKEAAKWQHRHVGGAETRYQNDRTTIAEWRAGETLRASGQSDCFQPAQRFGCRLPPRWWAGRVFRSHVCSMACWKVWLVAAPIVSEGGMQMSEKWTEENIPDQAGRVVLITGANSGIGYEAARALAQHGATVVMACRSRAKADDAVARISETDPSGTTEILEMDLSDLDSVKHAADEFLSTHDHLDVLINNAGLMATPEQRTAQGFEMQFGVNHVGHYVLTGLLLDVLKDTPGSRIVSISSQGHRPGKINFDDLNSEKSYSPWPAYFQSKLANLLFTRELQRRLADAGDDVIAVAAHPGGTSTNLGSESPPGILYKTMQLSRSVLGIMMQNAAMGALPTLRAATDPDVAGGDYFGPDGLGEQRGHPVKRGMSGRARDDDDARRLWTASEELTGMTYEF
jgi:NAD(P)-dependent dehydrogenase (short-subunit alcohol dehydrogenase family)